MNKNLLFSRDMRIVLKGSISSLVMAFYCQSAAYSEDAYIQTRSASLQAEPKLLAKSLKKFGYGDKVQIISNSDSWLKVSSAGRSGFIHQSAITTRKLTLTNKPGIGERVDDSDISLAGKGFSPEVEKQLAASNGTLNFREVDAMEKISISGELSKAFIKSGKLNQEGL